MLEIRNLESGYDKKQVLFGVNLNIQEAEIVALIGPNGAGKSTVLKAISGLLPIWNGDIYYNKLKINNSTPAQNVVKGISFAPQGSRVFHELTVEENLGLGGYLLPGKELKLQIEKIIEIFPILKNRYKQDAGLLSGGEQQMLALCRVLIAKPKLLLLDEPSLGLSPSLIHKIFEKISEIRKKMGISVLIVEQRVSEVLQISSRVYSFKLGRVSYEGSSKELKADSKKLKNLFL